MQIEKDAIGGRSIKDLSRRRVAGGGRRRNFTGPSFPAASGFPSRVIYGALIPMKFLEGSAVPPRQLPSTSLLYAGDGLPRPRRCTNRARGGYRLSRAFRFRNLFGEFILREAVGH